MSEYRVPNQRERRILERNHMNPEKAQIMYSSETRIRFLSLPERDIVTIDQGDRKWEGCE